MNMKVYLLFLLFSLFTSCNNSSYMKKIIIHIDTDKKCLITDSCRVIGDSISLYLYEVEKKSVLKIIHNNEYYTTDTLLLLPPCRFLRENNEIQSHSFKNIKVNHVIFIIGDKMATQKYSAIQGIVFYEDSIVISRRKIDADINENQWIDGKFFLDAAYYP